MKHRVLYIAIIACLSSITVHVDAYSGLQYIRWFDQIGLSDIALVGGKNASLGEMITHLVHEGISVPPGFAITADAYRYYMEANKLVEPIRHILNELSDENDIVVFAKASAEIRTLIENGLVPEDLKTEIIAAYQELSSNCKEHDVAVAVRSSATAEDLPTASFAGQQETFLNISGQKQLFDAYKKVIASLFTDRAIAYRKEHGFDHMSVAISIGVQKMVRSDLGASGVAFSLDPESGHKNFVLIESTYGLGEAMVQGLVNPDAVVVHKQMLQKGYNAIIKKECGTKQVKIVYADGSDATVKTVPVAQEEQSTFSLTDQEFLHLARSVLTIEEYYSQHNGQWTPMDIEWAKDGNNGVIYITQARPETVHSAQRDPAYTQYHLQHDPEGHNTILARGSSVGQAVVTGIARVVMDISQIDRVQPGDILVTGMTNPDWVPVMKKAAGIVTDQGGRTCHAAIVSRELSIPTIVGTTDATSMIADGQEITIDCSQGAIGVVYQGRIPFWTETFSLSEMPHVATDIMLNMANPDVACANSFLPVAGVGLARMEFIIANQIKIHPFAFVYPDRITNSAVRQEIDQLTAQYEKKSDYFVDKLAEGIATIAAAFYPRPVIVRLSDFKTNEYKNLIGGEYFEQDEENPMIGFRGAIRYYHEEYRQAFALECAALKKARESMGLTNIKIMVPFVRTTGEAEKVIKELKKNGLERGESDLEVVMMCEVPSNVFRIKQFCDYFDGFSIGSNDLTQLVLGVDRDSGLLASYFDERDKAVKKAIRLAIKGAHKHNRYIGICGQAPSDFPEIAQFLIDHQIDSMSLNADAVVPFLLRSSGRLPR